MSLWNQLTDRVADLLDDVLLSDAGKQRLKQAEVALAREAYSDAQRALQDVLAERNDIPRAHFLMGQSKEGLGDYRGAALAFERAIKLKPEAATFLKLSEALSALEDWRGARHALDRALEIAKEPRLRVRCHLELAAAYEQLGRSDKTVRECRKAIRIAEQRHLGAEADRATLVLGDALLATERAEECIAALTKLVEGGEPSAMGIAGRAYHMLGQPEAALKHLEAAMQKAGSSGAMLMAAVRSSLDLGELSKAERWLGELDIKTPEVAALAGRLALQSSRYPQARAHLDNAIQGGYLSTRARHDHAWVALRLGEEASHETRAEWLGKARRRFSTLERSASIVHGLALCHYLEGELDSARRMLFSVAERTPEMTHLLGTIMMELGAPAVAIQVLRDLPQEKASLERNRALLQKAFAALHPNLTWPQGDAFALEPWRKLVIEVRDRATQRATLRDYVPALQSILARLDAPLTVAMMGEFNAGKSTLVNALLGEKVVPTGVLPTTAHLNRMRYGTQRVAELHFGERTETIPFSEVKKRVKADDGRFEIEHIEFAFPNPDLRRVHFWDTPGFNAVRPEHEACAERALDDAEVILWVTDATQVMTASEMDRVRSINDAKDKLIVVVNKTDKLYSDADKDEIKQHLEQTVGDACRAVFFVSAKDGLGATLAEDETTLEKSGIKALASFLDEEVYDYATRYKAIDARHRLTGHQEAMKESLQAEQALYVQAMRSIELTRGGIQNWIRDLWARFDDETERITDQLNYVADLVAREISEALRPASGFVDVLLTRMELDVEDVDFALDLMRDRSQDVIARAHRRLELSLLEAEERFVSAQDMALTELSSDARANLQHRIETYLATTRTLRMWLKERVFERYRVRIESRLVGNEARQLIREVAEERDLSANARIQRLHKLQPDAGKVLREGIEEWTQQYAEAAGRLCAEMIADLEVLIVETETLSDSLLDKPFVETDPSGAEGD